MTTDDKATCSICPKECELAPLETGPCRVRGNRDGEVRLLSYGKISTAALGPIEQKPFFHYMPGSIVLSVGGPGCNMTCAFCQNFEISQVGPAAPGEQRDPEGLVLEAISSGAKSIVFTYNEPIVMAEYVLDVAQEARQAGLPVAIKTNGYATKTTFDELCWAVEAMNVDVKGDSVAYDAVCGIEVSQDPARWEIMRNIEASSKSCHLELSVIVLPDQRGLPAILNELATRVPRDTPLHLLRFYPDFRMKDLGPTPEYQMKEAYDAASGHFCHVYRAGEDSVSRCPWCGFGMVVRSGMKVVENHLGDQSCPECRRPVNFVLGGT